jgi:hypothetical protein
MSAAAGVTIPILMSLLGGLFNRGGESGGMSATQQNLMDAALRMQNNRMLLQNPLYEEATQLARALLPRSARPSSYALTGINSPVGTEGGGRQRPSDAEVIGTAVRRGTQGTSPNTPMNGAVSSLANGLTSPVNLYRDEIARGRTRA